MVLFNFSKCVALSIVVTVSASSAWADCRTFFRTVQNGDLVLMQAGFYDSRSKLKRIEDNVGLAQEQKMKIMQEPNTAAVLNREVQIKNIESNSIVAALTAYTKNFESDSSTRSAQRRISKIVLIDDLFANK